MPFKNYVEFLAQHNETCEVKIECTDSESYALIYNPCSEEQKENIQRCFGDIISESVADFGAKFITNTQFH